NHLNRNKKDGFMEALLSRREDLRGMPFLLGGDCRASAEQAEVFSETVGLIRGALLAARSDDEAGTRQTGAAYSKTVWDRLAAQFTPRMLRFEHRRLASRVGEFESVIEPALVAALMQMVTPGAEAYGTTTPQAPGLDRTWRRRACPNEARAVF